LGSVRIVSGSLKGRHLRVATGVRPSGARLREALFSYWGEAVAGSVFFDLFAGTGAMALEAISRGAKHCVLFEAEGKVIAQLRKNCEIAPAGTIDIERARLPKDLERRIGRHDACDLAFADPPYDFRDYDRLLLALEPLLKATGSVTLEHSTNAELPRVAGSLQLKESRRYGDSMVSIYRKVRSEEEISVDGPSVPGRCMAQES